MLYIVTWNKDKYLQISEALDGVESQQRDLDIPEIQTNLLTEISYDKCLQAYVEVQWPVLVDDSGIYFDAFDEFPGALSKFLYQGIGLEWMQKLYVDQLNTKATFQCVLSYMDEDLPEPLQFIWEIEGQVDFSLLGTQEENPKIPYDLIFVPKGMTVPAITNMDLWKKEFNHRVRGVKKFANWYFSEKLL